MRETPNHPVILVWYCPEDWAELKERLADGDCLPKTYDEWLDETEILMTAVLAAGHDIVKVEIDPKELAIWCAQRYCDMDAEARAAFASEVVRQTLQLG